MKNIKYILSALVLIVLIQACKKSSFEDFYRDPGKVTSSSIEKQFVGYLYSMRDLAVPSYWNYFVIMRNTMIRYTQANGFVNEQNQLNLGAASSEDRWRTYYAGLSQYRELEALYNEALEDEQRDKRIFMIASKIFFYDQTQHVVDLHGSIPWTEAGKVKQNGGDYDQSYPKYDDAKTIYTTMLDDLKAMSDELNTITLTTAMESLFKTQDLINSGDLDLWKRYCNSLRIRMLTRVKDVPEFSGRYDSEMAQILNNATDYPIVLLNEDNIQIDIFNQGSPINSTGLRDALESWNFNLAGKKLIDQLNTTNDPRLRYMFQPGDSAENVFIGLDPMLNAGTQNDLVTDGVIAFYNRSTYSRNQFFPGILISAAEINFFVSEYYLGESNDTEARNHFENGIRESIKQYVQIRSVSNDNSVPAPATPNATAVNNFINGLDWNGAANKLHLIATQKWVHYNIIQPIENWSEIRRLDYPTFDFRIDASDIQQTTPNRWTIPPSELNYNSSNYEQVSANDNLNTKLFWDLQ